MPNGDPAQGAEEDSQVDMEDVCAAPVKHATLQEDFSTVLVPSGSIHDQIDFRFGPSSPDIPSEDSDNVGYGWCGEKGRKGSKWFHWDIPLSPSLLQHRSPAHAHGEPRVLHTQTSVPHNLSWFTILC